MRASHSYMRVDAEKKVLFEENLKLGFVISIWWVIESFNQRRQRALTAN